MRTSSPIGSLVRAGLALLLVGGALACSSDSGTDADSAGSGADSGGGTGASLAPTTTAPTTTTVGVAPAVEATGTVTHGTLSFGGRERTYRLYVPRDLPDGPVPLFIGLHGGLGWGDQFATTDHSEGLAESNGFVVVHPDGVEVAGGRGGVWNGGVCCGVAARTDVDDVGFIAALIDRLAADHDIDPHRVFAFGHSNGGIMSYRLACELADRIAGVGVVEGTLGVDGCAPSEPVSILQVHGAADRSLPLAGGAGTDSLAGVDFPPPRDGFASLAAADGCPAPAETTDGDVTTALSRPCAGGTAAAFVTIATGPHAYPGGTPAVRPRSGPGYPGYDATAEIVSFLLSHPRAG
ncbi:MAG TPA: PHB depolymerase family esterase [Acidimicrobiales bacterium]|nr:PHB depolymerase family esterase [Acidimicrobiales bacterium]